MAESAWFGRKVSKMDQLCHQNGEIHAPLFITVGRSFSSRTEMTGPLGRAPHLRDFTFRVSSETDAQELRELMKVRDAPAWNGRHRKH